MKSNDCRDDRFKFNLCMCVYVSAGGIPADRYENAFDSM